MAYNIALVGTGLMAQEHIRTLRLRPDVAIAALADPTPASIDWARATLGEAGLQVPAFPDVASLLAGARPDAVIVCSPNHTHRAVLETLLRTDIPVLCEKPLATTMADCRFLVGLAAQRRGLLWIGMEYRYAPPVASFIQAVHSGKIGRLVRVSMVEHRFPFLRKVGDWNRFNANTGGTMVEKCCHFFDLMRLIIGAEPVRVFCSGAMDVNHRDEIYDGRRPDIIDNSYSIVDFDNGVRAMLDLCMFAEGSEEQEELIAIGDGAKLSVGIPSGMLTFSPRVPVGAPKPIERRHVAVEPDILVAGHHHGATYYQHEAFFAAIAGQAPVAVSAQDGLMAVAMGCAAEISAREKRVVTMDEVLEG